MDGMGTPVVVTLNVHAVPTTQVLLLALVMAGSWLTVRVNACAGVEPTVFVAVKVIA